MRGILEALVFERIFHKEAIDKILEYPNSQFEPVDSYCGVNEVHKDEEHRVGTVEIVAGIISVEEPSQVIGVGNRLLEAIHQLSNWLNSQSECVICEVVSVVEVLGNSNFFTFLAAVVIAMIPVLNTITKSTFKLITKIIEAMIAEKQRNKTTDDEDSKDEDASSVVCNRYRRFRMPLVA